MLRLFVAVDPSEAVRASLTSALDTRKRAAPDAKWVDPASIHLTVFFIGWAPDDSADEIARALAPVGAKHRAFEVSFAGAGTFGPPLRPRVLWVGLGRGGEALGALEEDVRASLVAIGFTAEERAYSPHVTLARARGHGGDARLAEARDALAEIDHGACMIDALILYQSKNEPGGARYTPLVRIALSGRGMTYAPVE